MTNRLYGDKTWDYILNESMTAIGRLCKTKGEEYKASDNDQLANFRRFAERLGLPMEAVLMTHMLKHWDALETYITDLTHNKTRPRAEPLESRVDDIIVYLILFKAMLAERQYGLSYVCERCGGNEAEVARCRDTHLECVAAQRKLGK